MALLNYVAPTIPPSGTTWSQYTVGGMKRVLDNLIAACPVKANPTVAATTAITTAAGGLPAGTYFAAYTFVDAFGETMVGASQTATAFTVTGTTQLCTLTVPAKPTGVQSINIYLTAPGGASGTGRRYKSGITGTAVPMDDTPAPDPEPDPGPFPGPPRVGEPIWNTTGAAPHSQRIYSIIEQGSIAGMLSQFSGDGSYYVGGQPFPGMTKLWCTALDEIGTLIAANN